MSAWLDAHPRSPPSCAARAPTGRDGLPAESVLRCALLKQYRQLSYQNWRFICRPRRFAPLLGCRCIGARRSLLKRRSARSAPGPGSGSIAVYWPAPARPRSRPARCCAWKPVTETIHERATLLLCDAMRIMVRLLDAAGDLPQAPAIAWHNHSRGPSGVPRPSIIAASRPSGRSQGSPSPARPWAICVPPRPG